MNAEFSEESLRKIAEQKISYRSTVKIHTVIYLMVCGLLGFINLLFTPNLLWFLFPMFAWLIGVSIHSGNYIMYARGVYPASKRAVLNVFIAYLFGMFLLWVINIVISFRIGFFGSQLTLENEWNKFILRDCWAIYPTIFAGAGVFILMIVYFIFLKEKLTEEGVKSKKEIAIEKEMRKMRNKQRNQ